MIKCSKIYNHLPHGESFYCIENIEMTAEHEAICTAIFRTGTVYECAEGAHSSLALLEATAHAGALASFGRSADNSRTGGVIISVDHCDLRVSEIRLGTPYRLHVKVAEVIDGVLEVSSMVSGETGELGSVSMLIQRKRMES